MRYLFSSTDYERTGPPRGYNIDNFSLDRMRRLLGKLGAPHRMLNAVHIAGTKGKGSTAAMLAAMLQGSGFRVGLYTSPHLVELRERIQVNGRMISEPELRVLLGKVFTAVKKLGNGREPTFFEIMTAVAFVHFVEKDVDVAVIESGLGGRLDSTNVLRPKVCGITSISHDHCQQLGDTLGSIASEKAGIFKRGVPAVSVPQEAEAEQALRKVASAAGTSVAFTGKDIDFSLRFESTKGGGPQTRVCVTTPLSRFEHLRVPLAGEHQAVNCGLALALLDKLKELGYDIDDERAIRGLSRTVLPGRMELLHSDPRVIVDGAHNPGSIEALILAIGQNISYDSMVVIFGCCVDKDVSNMLRRVRQGADKVIFTRSSSPRSADPEELANMYSSLGGMCQATDSFPEALRQAYAAISRGDLICVTGSFYLVGEAKKYFKQVS
ncbi:MAG: bifunctional folylpolyglutamate synthase/dihydrofolate synthase [Phycisphaerae bacterium]|nr:bifunctional folylpolyglutamate synthase/dihydrofolate synthase [Phycisphaerae bacterium]